MSLPRIGTGDGQRQTAMDHLDSATAAGIDAVLLPLPLPLQINLLERQNADLVTQLAENQRTVAAARVSDCIG